MQDAREFLKETEYDLARAEAERRRLELLAAAYENKLKNEVDPDSEEWAKTWAKLEEIRNQLREYKEERFCIRLAVPRYYNEQAKSHFNRLSRGMNTGYFEEWLKYEQFYSDPTAYDWNL